MKFVQIEKQFYGYIMPALSALFLICLTAIAIFSVTIDVTLCNRNDLQAGINKCLSEDAL